jgi:hypothetical protein
MTGLWIRLAHAMSCSLDPAEREAVFGDFAELDKSDRQILIGTSGLVLRRQLGFWKQWNPWFVLGAIVLPVCPVLATLSDNLGQSLFPNLVMWLHHRMPYETGVSLSALLTAFCCQAAALVTWSWTSAFALGTLSRKTIWVNGILFLILCVVCGIYGSLFSFGFLWSVPLASIAVCVKFPLVLLPAYFGLRHSSRSAEVKLLWMIPLAGWTATVGCLALWTQCWAGAAMDNWSHGASALTLLQIAQRADVWRLLLAHLFLAVVLTGPVFYLLASRVKRRPTTCHPDRSVA